MDIEMVKDELLKNPEYDNEWVESASVLISKYDVSISDIDKFCAAQLQMLVEAFKQCSDAEWFINKLIESNLNTTQMAILIMAKTQNASDDIVKYYMDRKDIPFTKMNYCVKAEMDGLPIHELINIDEFDADQIYEIYAGYMENVNYKSYAKSFISAKIMNTIRTALMNGAIECKIDKNSISFSYEEERLYNEILCNIL